MESNELVFLILVGVIVLLGSALILFACRIEKQRIRLNLMEETLNAWHSNFAEFRGLWDILAKGLDATNKRVDWLVKCNEDNLPALEATKEREAKHGKA